MNRRSAPPARDRRPDGTSDRGSATVWAAALIAVLLVVGAAGIDLVSAVRARHVAGSAADLSALAAAGRSSEGTDGACAAARSTAEANGAVLRRCRLDGWDAVVVVEVHRGWTLLGRGPAEAAARAGPAPDDGTAPAPRDGGS